MDKRKLRVDTQKHISQVRLLLVFIIDDLMHKLIEHDLTKLEEPELSIFLKYSTELGSIPYGSDEYKEKLLQLRDALDHHYKKNPHHPQHYERGVEDMTLMDLIEMLCDWISASRQSETGNIHESILINQERFGYSDFLVKVLENTIKKLESLEMQNNSRFYYFEK